MPQVAGKKFPYTKKGRAAAQAELKRRKTPFKAKPAVGPTGKKLKYAKGARRPTSGPEYDLNKKK